MGRAFQLMQKQVAGRRAARVGYVKTEERLRNCEVAILELFAFHVKHHATDKDNPSHHALVAAATDFKATLERTLGG